MRRMFGFFCVCLSIVAPLSADAPADAKTLDQQIRLLEERDRVLKARIRYQQNEAQRQLHSDFTNYNYHNRTIDQLQQEDKQVLDQIDALKKQRVK